jgi:lysophospholipase L1-like esterase
MARPCPLRETLVLILMLAWLPGCVSTDRNATGRSEAPAARAKVMIIGDSISIGYFEPTKALLSQEADVYHNAGNAQHTAYGLAQLNQWLGDTPWDVIHFNHGLHDVKYVDADGKRVSPAGGTQQIPLAAYTRNLETLTLRLKQTGATVIFATTTPIPEGAFGRVPGDAARYNEIARKIMKRHHVPINDLYAFALPRLDSIQRPHDVHFTEEGSQLLAEEVAQSVRKALKK